jgi:hypothetical protein
LVITEGTAAHPIIEKSDASIRTRQFSSAACWFMVRLRIVRIAAMNLPTGESVRQSSAT